MKKIFLTEADRKKIISDREKAIVESFAKTFNSIKRIDENEINEDNSLDVNEVLTKQVTTGTGWDTKTKTVQQGNLELNSYSKQLYQLFKKEGANPALLSGKGVANQQTKNNVVITAWDDELKILIQNVNDPMAMANKYGPMIEKQFPKLKLTKKPTLAGWGDGVDFTFTLENGGVQQQQQPVNNQQ